MLLLTNIYFSNYNKKKAKKVLDIIRNCQIEEGSEIRVFEKFNGGLIIGNKHKRIAISDDAAARIQV